MNRERNAKNEFHRSNCAGRVLATLVIAVLAMVTAGDTNLLTASAAKSRAALGDEGGLPDLGGAIGWLNSAPLSSKSLRGKVVLVNFWTYSCINSLRECLT